MSHTLRHFYQINKNGDPIPGSNMSLKKKPTSFGQGQRWVEYTPAGIAFPCCTSGPLLVTSLHHKQRYYVRLRDAGVVGSNPMPIAGTLEKHKNPPPIYKWQEVIGKHQCATLPQFNATYAWKGTNPLSINIIALLGEGIGYGSTLVENTTAIPTNEGHMTVDALHSGALTIHQNAAGTSHTDTITLHYSNGTCTFAFQLSLSFQHS